MHAFSHELKQGIMENVNKDFTPSDAIMSRCISTSISLLWTEEQIREKGNKMVAAIKKVLQNQSVTSSAK
jgi:8-amino-3,8-dideoxy-alpha-D-manno-octulosonate transaminase